MPTPTTIVCSSQCWWTDERVVNVAHDRDTWVDLGELCESSHCVSLSRMQATTEVSLSSPSMAMMALVKLHSAPLYSASVSIPISCGQSGADVNARAARQAGGPSRNGRTPCSKRPEMTAGSMISLSSISRTLGPTTSSAKRLTKAVRKRKGHHKGTRSSARLT